ncbi:unnamed protein product [Parnassius mnemosyne]|uniref:Salivary secreted peptide n=1 Tax=Parnassius mnemosyne TaxID=213953 RepID=A0AAV1KCK2_9NEOP
MKIQALLLLEVASLLVCNCEHLIIGDSSNKDMVYHTAARFNAIPYKRRVENIFYSNPQQKKIKSILVYDNMHSDAIARVTAGGVGYTFVNIRLKSEKGRRVDYDIGIYA